jgi:hypothetical protein
MAKKKKNISFTKSLLIPPQQGEASPFIENPRLGKRLILRKRDPKLSMLNSISKINKAMKNNSEEEKDNH